MIEQGEEQRDDVAPCEDDSRLPVDALLSGEACGGLGRDQHAKLREDCQLCPGWIMICHPGNPGCDRPPATLKITGSGIAVCAILKYPTYETTSEHLNEYMSLEISFVSRTSWEAPNILRVLILREILL